MRSLFIPLLFLIGCADQQTDTSLVLEQRDTIQAISLLGDSLVMTTPPARIMAAYDSIKAIYEKDPGNVDQLIWYGRWAAYSGDHKKAISIFSKGIEQFPDEARLYRHRGHRYITTRQFAKAIADLEKAKSLTAGKADVIEPDGQPNAMNIPVSTLQGNILYHLGLAYYLQGDWEKALSVYELAWKTVTTNNDQRASLAHWIYMTARLLNQPAKASSILDQIHEQDVIIENQVYHRLCLFYKGVLSQDSLVGAANGKASSNDALLYGIANWYHYNNRPKEAAAMIDQILAGKGWASFGYIAAEADKKRYHIDHQ